MIKFNKIIHKETGTVINYLDWLKALKDQEPIEFLDVKTGKWIYRADYMVLTDGEFEIVYEDPNFDIECPYCKHKHEGLDYVDTGDMEGEFSMTCENEECGKEFQVSFITLIKFKAKK